MTHVQTTHIIIKGYLLTYLLVNKVCVKIDGSWEWLRMLNYCNCSSTRRLVCVVTF